LNAAIEGRAHPADCGVSDCPLDVGNDLAGFGLVPTPIEILGCEPELHDQIVGEIQRLDLTPLFLPQSYQGSFIVAHNDPRIGAADEPAPIDKFRRPIHDTPPSASERTTTECMDLWTPSGAHL
jgi:hypothetical protein